MPEGVEDYTEIISDLRHELKAWEKSFAAANGGRKAGREDIKKDVKICKITLMHIALRSILMSCNSCEISRIRSPCEESFRWSFYAAQRTQMQCGRSEATGID